MVLTIALLGCDGAGPESAPRPDRELNAEPGQRSPASIAISSTALPAAPLAAPPTDVAEDGQWTMPAKDHASLRFSGLDDIDASNVATLRVAWTFKTGLNSGHEAAPLVVSDTMYVVTPFPNELYAFDLTRPPAVK